MNKIGIYIRVGKNGNHNNSIYIQRHILHDFLNKRTDYILVDNYIDIGYPAVDFNRPEFNRLMQDIEKGKIDTILCVRLSTITRDILYFRNYSLNSKFSLITIKDNIDIKDINEFFKNRYNKICEVLERELH